MRTLLLCLLSIATVASLSAGAAVRAQGTQVLVVPPSSMSAPGATVVVEVQIREVLDLYAVDLQLAFDPAILEVLDADGEAANGTQVTAGSFLSSAYMFTAVNRADNATGQIRYLVSLLAPAAPRSGSGLLASIAFRARDPGSSTLRLQVLLADDQAGYMPAVVSDGLIIVTGDTATPTATTIPTRTPTATFTPTAIRTPTPSSTRTGTPVPEHFLWLPLLLRLHSVPTLTPLPSATPTLTLIPAPTASATPTVEHTPSPSPTASTLPSPTVSATPTFEATPSPSPSGTITPAATRSPTATPTTTVTPTIVATLSPTPVSQQLLLNSGFETDTAWAPDGGAPPVYSMARAHSGARSMRLGIILPQSQAVYSSVWQEVDLPSRISEARLSLYCFPAGWPEDTDHLYLYVTRASDGAILFSDSWMQWDQTWHPYTVDLLSRLQPYAGQRVRLRIGLYNNGDGMTAVYVDDVELWLTYASNQMIMSLKGDGSIK